MRLDAVWWVGSVQGDLKDPLAARVGRVENLPPLLDQRRNNNVDPKHLVGDFYKLQESQRERA